MCLGFSVQPPYNDGWRIFKENITVDGGLASEKVNKERKLQEMIYHQGEDVRLIEAPVKRFKEEG